MGIVAIEPVETARTVRAACVIQRHAYAAFGRLHVTNQT